MHRLGETAGQIEISDLLTDVLHSAGASSEQENVVAMGLRATLAQSDISTKLTIAAKAFSGGPQTSTSKITLSVARGVGSRACSCSL